MWTANRTNHQRRVYWPRLLGSLSAILLVTLVLIHSPLYNTDPSFSQEKGIDESITVVFEDLPIPIVSQQSVVPNAPAKPSVLFQIDEVDLEESMTVDLQGINVAPTDFQGRVVLRPDTPIRVLTIVEPTFDAMGLPDIWRGERVQVRMLIGLRGEVRHSEILSESLPYVVDKAIIIKQLQNKIDAALSEWAFRPASHNGQTVLSYTVQTFRL
ncbi:MAG TPA: hypothetical protein DEF03_01670 [Bacteroidetes bacterium]|nr:hypothetical protein [Bacteroidota bacterium]